MSEFEQYFKIIGIDPQDYFVKFAMPLFVTFIIVGFIMQFALAPLLGDMGFVVLLIPMFGILLVLLYPKVLVDKKRIEIDQNLHLFITHVGTLSTAEVDRKGLFKLIGGRKDYQELSRQCGKIAKLVEEWGMSLPEACKFQAKRCPSRIFRDFLERFAYNIDAGQPVDDFLMGEQNTIMNEFETMYINALKDVDIFKELFLSMVLSIAFAVVFATILPAITGSSPTFMIVITVVLFAMIEVGFLYAMYSRIPKDQLWGKFATKTKSEKQLDKYILVSYIGVIILGICLAMAFAGIAFTFINGLPLLLKLCIPLLPLLLPGFGSRKVEKIMREKDKQFPSFIRSLGAAESAKQTTTTYALRTLQYKDFGELTQLVKNLYKRLNMRINQEHSWHMFMKEGETFIISRFSEMYLDAKIKGGVAEKLGKIIAINVEKIRALRTFRAQTTTTLIGVLYGITASLSFSLYIGIMVVDMMASSMDMIDLGDGVPAASVVSLQQYNIGEVDFLISFLLIIHCLLSSIMIKIVDGGHQVNAYFHFVLMLLISAVGALAVSHGMGALITI